MLLNVEMMLNLMLQIWIRVLLKKLAHCNAMPFQQLPCVALLKQQDRQLFTWRRNVLHPLLLQKTILRSVIYTSPEWHAAVVLLSLRVDYSKFRVF